MSKTIALKFKFDGRTDILSFDSSTKVKEALRQYLASKNLDSDPSEEKYTFMYGALNHINSQFVLNKTLKEAKVKNNGLINVEQKNNILLG